MGQVFKACWPCDAPQAQKSLALTRLTLQTVVAHLNDSKNESKCEKSTQFDVDLDVNLN
jgi:hypothetical protein